MTPKGGKLDPSQMSILPTPSPPYEKMLDWKPEGHVPALFKFFERNRKWGWIHRNAYSEWQPVSYLGLCQRGIEVDPLSWKCHHQGRTREASLQGKARAQRATRTHFWIGKEASTLSSSCCLSSRELKQIISCWKDENTLSLDPPSFFFLLT